MWDENILNYRFFNLTLITNPLGVGILNKLHRKLPLDRVKFEANLLFSRGDIIMNCEYWKKEIINLNLFRLSLHFHSFYIQIRQVCIRWSKNFRSNFFVKFFFDQKKFSKTLEKGRGSRPKFCDITMDVPKGIIKNPSGHPINYNKIIYPPR